MKAISFYHAESGLFHDKQLLVSDESTIALNCPEGHLPIDGHHDYLCKRVDLDTKEIIDHQPQQPSGEHEWNPETKRWQLNAKAHERIARSHSARARIAHLETNVQPRAVREVALNKPDATKRLQDIDDEIAGLRKQLGQG